MNVLHLHYPLPDDYGDESDCGDYPMSGYDCGHGCGCDGCDANVIPFFVVLLLHQLLVHFLWNGCDRVNVDCYCVHVNGGGCANENDHDDPEQKDLLLFQERVQIRVGRCSAHATSLQQSAQTLARPAPRTIQTPLSSLADHFPSHMIFGLEAFQIVSQIFHRLLPKDGVDEEESRQHQDMPQVTCLLPPR